MEKYILLLFPILENSRKELKQKILKALYEMGKDGDFTRIQNEKVDTILEQIGNDENMPDFIGDLYHILSKNST